MKILYHDLEKVSSFADLSIQTRRTPEGYDASERFRFLDTVIEFKASIGIGPKTRAFLLDLAYVFDDHLETHLKPKLEHIFN
jgi:hypothetical protein